jgi:Zn-dependent protease with chaperone function
MNYISEKVINEFDAKKELISISYFAFVSVIFRIGLLFMSLIFMFIQTRFGKRNEKIEIKIQEIVNDTNVKVIRITSTDPNAFNSGIRTLYYTTGLERLLKNDKLLISVLLHEYGHFEGKHVIKSVSMNMATGILFDTIIYYLIIRRSKYASSDILILGGLISFMLHQMTVGIYIDVTKGREYEYYADSYAVKMGYGKEISKSLNLLNMWIRREFCKDEHGMPVSKGDCDDMMEQAFRFDEHPTIDNRLNNIKEQIKDAIKNKKFFKAFRLMISIRKLNNV